MPLKDYKDPNDRMTKIENPDNSIFKKAYLELKSSTEYAKQHFKDFPVYHQLKKALVKYTPRFNQLTH